MNNVRELRPKDKPYTSKDKANQEALDMSHSAKTLAQLCQVYVGAFKTMQAVAGTKALDKAVEQADEAMTAVMIQSILIVNRFAPEVYEQVRLIEEGEDLE